MLRRVADGLRREIAVQHHGVGGIERADAALQIFRREGGGHVRVAHGQRHVPGGIGDVQVRGGAPAGNTPGQAHVKAQRRAALEDFGGIAVPAQGGDEGHVHVQQAQIVGDVAAHAAGGEGDGAGVGIPHDEGREGLAADVHIHGAHNGGMIHFPIPQMLSAYSFTARSAAKMPLSATFTRDIRPSAAGSEMAPYSASWQWR